MAYSLQGVDLGTVTHEHPKAESNIIPDPLPTTGSESTHVFEYGGAIFYADIDGTLNGSSIEGLQAKVVALFNLVSGNQQTTRAFISDITGSRNVKVIGVSGDYRKAEPLTFDYMIKLVEASTDV